ncbi:hypothetical protein [Longirhabdus pacifica]|uniref:hypothetical protein n=1 Tax=Longirhabdus pacifica TaxID=2305227 RepID=UPI00100929BE|nr:hypothetical protein [Longirhabdus pacifica]
MRKVQYIFLLCLSFIFISIPSTFADEKHTAPSVIIQHEQFPEVKAYSTVQGDVHRYHMMFDVPMDRATVETALKKSTWIKDVTHHLDFQWEVDSRQVWVEVNYDEEQLNKAVHRYSSQRLVIDVNGAKTKEGVAMEDAKAFMVYIDDAGSVEKVHISLASTPEIQAPIRTPVSTLNQKYQLVFTEEMNTSSVEEALQKNIKSYEVAVQLDYAWKTDKEVIVEIQLEGEVLDSYYDPTYQLNVTGALTKKGDKLLSSPPFKVYVWEELEQLWRVSLDGSRVEQVTDWNTLYKPVAILNDNDIVLAREKEYFCCHGPYVTLFGMYNIEQQELTSYPVAASRLPEALTNYIGPGSFYADMRGFFYFGDEESISLTNLEQQETVQVNTEGYVHGATFSKDKKHIIFLSSSSLEDRANLDLMLYTIDSKQYRTLIENVPGISPIYDLYDRGDPQRIPMYDDGDTFTFMMYVDGKSQYYDYHWQSGEMVEKKIPFSYDYNLHIVPSHDGAYQLYLPYDQSWTLFEGTNEVAVMEERIYSPTWINDHQFVYQKVKDQDEGKSIIYAYDLLMMEEQIFLEDRLESPHIIGATEKWIYVAAP